MFSSISATSPLPKSTELLRLSNSMKCKSVVKQRTRLSRFPCKFCGLTIRNYNTSIHRSWLTKPLIKVLNFKRVKRRNHRRKSLLKGILFLKHKLVHSQSLNETRRLLFLIRRLQVTVKKLN